MSKHINKLNDILGRELGYVPGNRPKYMWKFSENWKRTKRLYTDVLGELKPEWEYKANSTSGLIEVFPAYVEEKLCPDHHSQWIIAVWIDPKGFEEFRKLYGDGMAWSKTDNYWPVSHPKGIVCLRPFQVPSEDDTWKFIYQAKLDMSKTEADLEKAYDARHESILKEDIDKLQGQIMDLPGMPTYDSLPGVRGNNWQIAETKQDSRIKENIWQR